MVTTRERRKYLPLSTPLGSGTVTIEKNGNYKNKKEIFTLINAARF
jgi:hypothetical protein